MNCFCLLRVRHKCVLQSGLSNSRVNFPNAVERIPECASPNSGTKSYIKNALSANGLAIEVFVVSCLFSAICITSKSTTATVGHSRWSSATQQPCGGQWTRCTKNVRQGPQGPWHPPIQPHSRVILFFKLFPPKFILENLQFAKRLLRVLRTILWHCCALVPSSYFLRLDCKK